MTWIGIAQILIFFLILLAITKPLGTFMYRLFEGERTFLHPILHPLEKLIYRIGGVNENEEQSWIQYAASTISLSMFSFLVCVSVTAMAGTFASQSRAFLNTSGAPNRHPHDARFGL